MSEEKKGGESLSILSQELTRLAERSARSVVSLNTRGGFPTSGTVWENGYIVTADHAVHGEDGIIVAFADSTEKPAEIVGRDSGTDIALLKCDTGDRGFARTLEPKNMRPGMLAVALSRNSERSLNASLAVVNAIGGEWRTLAGSAIDNYLRIDVRTYAGFSGGPLVDVEGSLIGINNSRLSRHSVVSVPASTVSKVVAELKEHGKIRRGYLGVATLPVGLDESLGARLGLKQSGGLIVVQVEQGSGADRAGLMQGDILMQVGGTPVGDPEELQQALGAETIGTSVSVRIVRGGALEELAVEVAERPAPRGYRHHHWPAHRHARHGGR